MTGLRKPKSIEKSCYIYRETWSSKNDLLLEEVSISSCKKFIFNCLKCNHDYEQSPDKKTSGRGCPYCANQKRCGGCERCLKNSCFIYKHEWSDKNKEKCEEVAIGSDKKFLFNCLNCSHEYEQSPGTKSKGVGCPYCANQKRCGSCERCLKNSCYKYKYIWSDKNKEKCEEVAIGSHKKFLFNCLNCSHEYEQSPNSKSKGRGCPYCANQKRCGNCTMCLKNSCFSYKDIWSHNNKEKCEDVALSSKKKFIFNCDTCIHEYEQSPANKTNLGASCPYCANKLRCGECEKCLKNSCFIYKHTWSDKNKEKCEYVALSSNKKYLFNCDICNHEYEQSPNSKSKGIGCPFCSNQKRCGECDMCLDKSCFRYKYDWSDKNKDNCEEVAIGSDKKFIFNCYTCNHEYEQSPNSKSNQGAGCPQCVNKTELKVSNFLVEQNINFKSQYKIKNIRKYYDFYLPDFNLILEIDGDQHFRQVSNWDCHEQTMKNDIEKMKTGLENSLSFLRIYQPDIWEDKIDWKTVILKNLYKRTLPDISYISSKTDIYDSHKNQPYEEIK